LSEIQEDVERLEAEKIQAVQEERYDDAKRAKLEVERLISSALRPNGKGFADESSCAESDSEHLKPHRFSKNNSPRAAGQRDGYHRGSRAQ